jgi:hypothetical protein
MKFARRSSYTRLSIRFSVLLLHITPYSNPFTQFTMFQRTFLRQARAARSPLTTISSTTVTPLALRPASRFQTQLPAIAQGIAPRGRFYSTEPEQKDAPKEGEAAEETPLEQAQKKIEEKEKEIIELKVSYPT